MITKDIIEQVKDTANIVELISEYVSLKKQGVYYVGICPFHDDHHPSMKVSPNRGTYHCYSCDAKGDAIKFLQEMEHISFPEAVRRLANKYGVAISSEEKTEEERKHDRLIANLYKTNAWVAHFYVDALGKSAEDSAVKQILKIIAAVPSPVTQESYLQECSAVIGYSVEALKAEINTLS